MPVKRSSTPAFPASAPIAVRIDQAIAMSGLSRSSIYNHARAGRIKVQKDGRSALVEVESLLATVRGLPLASFAKTRVR